MKTAVIAWEIDTDNKSEPFAGTSSSYGALCDCWMYESYPQK